MMWTCSDCGDKKQGMGGGWPPSGWQMTMGRVAHVQCTLCNLRARAKAGDEWAQKQLTRLGVPW